eukprot:4843749-Pyramimonas_sp.AAC.1
MAGEVNVEGLLQRLLRAMQRARIHRQSRGLLAEHARRRGGLIVAKYSRTVTVQSQSQYNTVLGSIVKVGVFSQSICGAAVALQSAVQSHSHSKIKYSTDAVPMQYRCSTDAVQMQYRCSGTFTFKYGILIDVLS